MTAQQRFRLRRKLQSALLRLLVVIHEMQKNGVAANRENLGTVATTVIYLDSFLACPAGEGSAVKYPAAGCAAVKKAVERRVKETMKRRRRRGYKSQR